MELKDGFNTVSLTSILEYRKDKTPVVDNVMNPTGDVFGGYNITLSGSYLDIGTPSVMIDNVECVVRSNTASQIICEVGERTQLPSENTFKVVVGGRNALVKK